MKRKYKQIQNEEIKSKDQYHVEISLQLIFCFLNPIELTLVAKCCKQWYKAVTANFFFSIYRVGEFSLPFNVNNFPLFCSSPFRLILRDLSFSTEELGIVNLKFIPQLTQLNSLELQIDLDLTQNIKYNYLSVFKLFPSSIREFNLCVDGEMYSKSLLLRLMKAVSSLKQIEELHLEQREFNYDARNSIFSAIRSLPRFKSFESECPFSEKEILVSLRQLCDQPGVPTLLECLPTFENIEINDQEECAYLLKKLPSLKTINYDCVNSSVPQVLAPIIGCLYVGGHEITDDDIDIIISMNQLQSISIDTSKITELQFKRLFSRIGNQCTQLCLHQIQINPLILIDTLSNYCCKLQKLVLGFETNYLIGYASHMFKMNNCKLLEYLKIRLVDPTDSNASTLLLDQFRSTLLTLPSSIIPSLNHIVVKLVTF